LKGCVNPEFFLPHDIDVLEVVLWKVDPGCELRLELREVVCVPQFALIATGYPDLLSSLEAEAREFPLHFHVIGYQRTLEHFLDVFLLKLNGRTDPGCGVRDGRLLYHFLTST